MYKNINKFIKVLLCLTCLPGLCGTLALAQQYPGGVSTGTTRGYKVDVYDGNYTAVSQFGAGGTVKSTPDQVGYTNKITGVEYNSIGGTWADNYGIEYTGVLEIPVTGNYTFSIAADDHMSVFIDGTLHGVVTFNSGTQTFSVALNAGDHNLKVKYFEKTGTNNASFQFTAGPAGSGITATTPVDGRFVRSEGSKLSAWYKASNLGVTNNWGGAGVHKVNTIINMAPEYTGHGNMSMYWLPSAFPGTNVQPTVGNVTNLVNFNPAIKFGQLEEFRYGVDAIQKGLSYRGATKSMFMVADYLSNANQNNTWMFYHGEDGASGRVGLSKITSGVQLSTGASNAAVTSAFVINEPKLLGGFLQQPTGAAASATTNPVIAKANSVAGSVTNLAFNVVAAGRGITFGGIYNTRVPEAIYYPFELTPEQEQKVNTYLAVKYGISLPHDYISTSGSVVYSQSVNAGYTNRIFGIGRELAAEGLNQKQSQSQMVSATGNDFLVASKGAIALSNVTNGGVLADGDYLIMGDNNAALTIQSTEVPAAWAAATGCTVARLGREWKVQVAGNPGAITLRAGSTTPGSFKFPSNAAGLVVLIDTDGDGDFTTGTVTTVPVTSVDVNGVATFNNVSLATGNVFTFGYAVISPGGVSAGLSLWLRGDDLTTATAGSSWTSGGTIATATIAGSNQMSINNTNVLNYNRALNHTDGFNDYLTFTAHTIKSFFLVAKSNAPSAYNHMLYRHGTDDAATLHGAPGVYQSMSTGSVNVRKNGIWFSNGQGVIPDHPWNSEPQIVGLNMLSADGGVTVSSTGGQASAPIRDYNGTIGDIITYSGTLTATQRQQVETYLAIKYGVSLNITNGAAYLASNGSTNLYNHTAYANNIFGIGRDDCSGLVQKQSKSSVSGDNVAIGLGTIAASNGANTGIFSDNLQFTVIGNDGAALEGSAANIPAGFSSCNALRYARSWKVNNTGYPSSTPLQVQIGNRTYPINTNWSNVTLAIDSDGDGNFATGAPVLITPTSITAGVATFDNVVLADDAVFTVLYTLGYPGGVAQPISGTDINGANYVNGLAYKLYTSTSFVGAKSLITAFPDFIGTNAPLSTGYYNNLSLGIDLFFGQKVSNLYALEATGKLYIPSAGSYTFRAEGTTRNRMSFVVNGATAVDVQQASLSTVTGTAISFPAAGYYDFVYRIQNNNETGDRFALQWNAGTGAWAAIPDANFFVLPKGPSAWYAADNNLLDALADGTQMTAANGNTWPDMSGNKNDIQSESDALAPVYYSTSKAKLRNYNTVVEFTDDKMSINGYLNGFGFGRQGKTLIGVASMWSNAAQENLTGYGRDDRTNDLFRIIKTPGNLLQMEGLSNTLAGITPFYTSATRTTNIIQGVYANDNITTTGNAQIFADNANIISGTKSWDLTMNDAQQLTVGNSPEAINGNGWDGAFGEALYYPWNLSATERHRINSYLAIKWGVTLNQGIATSYVASDGSVIWNAATAGMFKNDITALGRDDCGALMQKQSTSTDADDIISMAKGSIATNNALNTGEFDNDKEFLFFAHNNAGINTTNTNNMPASLLGCYVKIDREWQVQTVGTPGAVTVEMGKNGLFNINAANYKPVLLVSNTAGDYTSATVVQAQSVYQGKATFSNVTFANGQYFTLAYIKAGPGGVTTNMTAWFSSDYDAFTDVAQTTYAENDGDEVRSINNLKFGSNIANLQQVGVNYNPLYKPGTFNYNTGLYFDGNNDALATATNVNTLDYRTTTQMTSVMAAATVPGSPGQVFWYHSPDTDGNGTAKTAMERSQVYWGQATSILRTPAVTNPEIYTFINNIGGAGLRLYKNLGLVASQAVYGNTGTVNGRFRIGNNSLIGTGSPGNFYLGEFVIYSDDKGASTTDDMRRIHSYMATKYGFTLDAASIGNAYVASDMTPTYNHTGFWNRITGIGRDDCAAFEQKQSFSQESVGALVKLSNNVDGLAATNMQNSAGFANDKSFLLFGDNGKDMNWNGTVKIGDGLVGLNRVWRVKESGTVNSVYLEVPSSSSSATYKLPPSITVDAPVYLAVSASGNFANPDALVEMVPDGNNNLSVTYNFADGDHYTFASKASCLGPAGITEGLTSWFKVDDEADGVIPATTGTFTEEAGRFTLTRDGTGTATVVPGTTGSNYNKVLTLASGAVLQTAGNLNESAITAINAGTVYAVSLNPTASHLFGLSRSNYNGVGIFNTPTFANTIGTYAGTPAAGNLPNIWNVTKDAGMLYGSVNGAVAAGSPHAGTLAVNATYGLRIGASYVGGTLTRGNNTFAEAFTFNRTLSVAEQQVLNSYLAIKYGQTLPHNYYSPVYNGMNAATTTIYDVSTYGNRVFGVGVDSLGCLFQKQSASVLPGSMLKMSIDAAMATENTLNPGAFELDRSYVVAGDDNEAINAWESATEVPAVYTSATDLCIIPQRIRREWKVKAHGNDQLLLVTVPDQASSLATKLPALPAGASKLYMVINENSDFTVNAAQEELEMTLNAATNEWELHYVFPKGIYKYITFTTKPDGTAPTPVVVLNGATDGTVSKCDSLPYLYYRGALPGNEDKAVLAVNPNGNTWAPSGITVDNQGTYASGGSGYYESTDGTHTLRITKRLHTVVAPGTYSVNGGVVVRIYYTAADLAAMQSDAFAGGANIERQGWFKSPESSATATVASMSPTNITAQELTPIASGTEDGVAYVEFLVNSFSTFGYFVKTTPEPLPVELLSFTATADGDCKVNLSWKSGIEHNLARYYVEQSTDANSFTTIGEVAAKGSNSDYRYATEVSTADKLFYRLKMLDRDGRYKHSSIAMVQANCKVSALRVYPNPANESVFVAGLEGNETIELLDYTGRLLKRSLSKATTHELSLSDHAAGLYLIKVINSNGSTATFKVVKH